MRCESPKGTLEIQAEVFESRRMVPSACPGSDQRCNGLDALQYTIRRSAPVTSCACADATKSNTPREIMVFVTSQRVLFSHLTALQAQTKAALGTNLNNFEAGGAARHERVTVRRLALADQLRVCSRLLCAHAAWAKRGVTKGARQGPAGTF